MNIAFLIQQKCIILIQSNLEKTTMNIINMFTWVDFFLQSVNTVVQ